LFVNHEILLELFLESNDLLFLYPASWGSATTSPPWEGTPPTSGLGSDTV
jgi:hypothetical protein